MKTLFTLIICSFFTLTSYTNPSDTIFLWQGQVPGETGEKHPPIQTDNNSNNVIRLTDITDPAIIVFKPKANTRNGAGIIVCPGGGYNILAMNLEGYEIAEWLNQLGYTAFVLQYRVPKKQEGALMDIQRAIRIVRSKADVWGIDPGKLGVLGFSAGGSLCARASTRFNEETYPGSDDIDRLSCRPDFSVLIYPAYLDQGENRSLTPELTITPETPPMFIFGTADDRWANSTLVMATALRDAKIPVELHLLPRGGHGYGLRTGNKAAETWPVLVETWLNIVNKP